VDITHIMRASHGPQRAYAVPHPFGAEDMDTTSLRAKFEVALDYEDYLATDPDKAGAWNDVYERVTLTEPQRRLIAGFTRQMNVLCVSGIWCGDCVQQGPLIAHIAEANPLIVLRWLDRDEHLDLAGKIAINAGLRVPTVIFMAEDYEPVAVYGDRTLTRYRAMASKKLGAACPLPGAPLPDDELAATLQDWLDEFERIELLLRLSPRLRAMHGD
jgi:thiol-disulfide isomerase/thioredoxin